MPVSPIITRARKFVKTLIINCVYYYTQLPDLGQTDINKFTLLNAAAASTDPANVKAYETRSGGLGRMLRDAVVTAKNEKSRGKSSTPRFTGFIERVFPVLRTWFSETADLVNEKYLEDVWTSYISDEELSQFVDPDQDFKNVVIYLIMTENMLLTTDTVLSYIYGNFCPLEYVLRQLCKGERVLTTGIFPGDAVVE